MKSWLKMTYAITLFVTGMIVGRFDLVPRLVAQAQSIPPAGVSVQTWGTAGGSFSWQQDDTSLAVTVTGQDVAYLAVADLADEDTWASQGLVDGEVLYAQDQFELDLTAVKELVFFRMEPIGGLSEGVFLPCSKLPAGCFPTRPPVFPPPVGRRSHVVVLESPEVDLEGL